MVPKLLHGRAALKLLEQAAHLFDGFVGQTRGEYDQRALENVLGDYRLARCIEACLLARYEFAQPRLEAMLVPEQVEGLAARGLNGPSDLRFAIWDAATEHGGYVAPSQRAEFLGGLAHGWDLPRDAALVDALTSLDSEAAQVLTRRSDAPTARELMRLYNQGVVKTLLAHSTRIEIGAGELPGAALKKLYFIAKRGGVLVDIEQAQAGEGYTVTLFGPEQAFGTAEKYGLRLADAALSLLRSTLSVSDRGRIGGMASLLLHDRPYRFHITGEVLERLEYAPEDAQHAKGRIAEQAAPYSVGSAVDAAEGETLAEPLFDSLVEARLYREYVSLQRGGYTHGWLLQREPEPLLAPGVVMIPDFAFLRGGTRVFMEIAGFWSPSYRERKLAKLRHLAALPGGPTALVLAVPNDAASFFKDLPFPVVPYKTGLRLNEVIELLDRRYGEREERQEAAAAGIPVLQQRALQEGFVPEREVAEALHAYTRTELLSAVRDLGSPGCTYVPGVGLLSNSALDRVRGSLEAGLRTAEHRLPLEEAAQLVEQVLSSPVDIESLLAVWEQWRVERPSLFEAFLVAEGAVE